MPGEASVQEILEEIYEQHGELTPHLVLDVARDPSHPLHHRFEWDDAVAGEKHRLHQARKIITTVRVRYASPSDDNRTIRARAYHSVPTPAGPVYRSTDDVVMDPFARKLLLQKMHRDWVAMQARYQGMQELWDMVADSVKNHRGELTA